MSMINFIKPEFSFSDSRGYLKQLVSSGWSQVNVIFSEGGAVRGNHWHEHAREMFYCVSGTFKLYLEKDGQGESYDIRTGDMFFIEPRVKHTFTYETDTTLVSLYDHCVVLADGKMDIHTESKG